MQQGAETEPSITHRARRNREFCLPPRLEPQDRAMPQRELQESTAQQKKTVLGTGDGLRGHARGREVLPKRLQTTPLTKPSRHMRKQLFFPPPSTPPPPLPSPWWVVVAYKSKIGRAVPREAAGGPPRSFPLGQWEAQSYRLGQTCSTRPSYSTLGRASDFILPRAEVAAREPSIWGVSKY